MRKPPKKFFENARQMFLVRLNMGAFSGTCHEVLKQNALCMRYLEITASETYAMYILNTLKEFDPENLDSFYPMYLILQPHISNPINDPEYLIHKYDIAVHYAVKRLTAK